MVKLEQETATAESFAAEMRKVKRLEAEQKIIAEYEHRRQTLVKRREQQAIAALAETAPVKTPDIVQPHVIGNLSLRPEPQFFDTSDIAPRPTPAVIAKTVSVPHGSSSVGSNSTANSSTSSNSSFSSNSNARSNGTNSAQGNDLVRLKAFTADDIQRQLATYTPAETLSILSRCTIPARQYLLDHIQQPMHSAIVYALEQNPEEITNGVNSGVDDFILGLQTGPSA